MNANIPTPRQGQAVSREGMSGLYIQVAARLAQRLDGEACKGSPLSPHLLAVLQTLQHNPGIRQGYCATMLGYDATTFGRYVDRLVQEGHVARSVPPLDRRAVSLELTEKGAAAVAQVRPAIYDLETETRRRMGDAAWAQLSMLLERYIEAHEHPLPLDAGRTAAAAD